MIVYPAMDLRGGRVVRLDQGDYARETAYPQHPVALASAYAAAGAAWLHVVDLDAARTGRFMHLDAVAEVARDSGLRVQYGGGVRHETAIETLFDAGVARVVIGSVAVREPPLVQRWLEKYGPDRITIALDTRADDGGGWRLPVDGWTATGSATLHDVLDGYRDHGAIRHVLCTDIARDGLLGGPNFALYEDLVARCPGVAVQVSGGVRGSADVSRARHLGAGGIVVGRALLAGQCTLRELLSC